MAIDSVRIRTAPDGPEDVVVEVAAIDSSDPSDIEIAIVRNDGALLGHATVYLGDLLAAIQVIRSSVRNDHA